MLRTMLIALVLQSSLWAQKPAVTIKDVSTEQDTSIEIKKGTSSKQCVEYQIIDGKDEVFGEAQKERAQAYTSWKTACTEWKNNMREMNKENQILQLNCNNPESTKAEYLITFKSEGTYKIKTKIKDKQ